MWGIRLTAVKPVAAAGGARGVDHTRSERSSRLYCRQATAYITGDKSPKDIIEGNVKWY